MPHHSARVPCGHGSGSRAVGISFDQPSLVVCYADVVNHGGCGVAIQVRALSPLTTPVSVGTMCGCSPVDEREALPGRSKAATAYTARAQLNEATPGANAQRPPCASASRREYSCAAHVETVQSRLLGPAFNSPRSLCHMVHPLLNIWPHTLRYREPTSQRTRLEVDTSDHQRSSLHNPR